MLLILGTAAVGAGLWYGYALLSQDLRDRIATLEQRAAGLQQALDRSQRARSTLSVELEETRARLRYIQTRYDREVPQGAARRLHDRVTRLLDEGVPEDRLAFLIRAAGASPDCRAPPQTRRLPVARPGQDDSGGVVRFADRRIAVTAEGETATDAAGRPEAWFDPEAPVRVRFSRVGGETETVRGRLPLHHSMIVDGAELRFTVEAGRPGYAAVTAETCALP
jgi:hypothetical protein